MFGNVYSKRRVLVTGHSGFKGSWLTLWLERLGASVLGISLPPETDPNHFSNLSLSNTQSEFFDIREGEKLRKVVNNFNPEVVFHLAAQPLVRKSYREPVNTFATNVLGSVHLLDACRTVSDLRAIVYITTDKVYRDKQWVWGYRETDELGGYDPYSASKACAELVCSCYRDSYWPMGEYGRNHNVLLSSVRAGNVIGGGDWSEDRLIPDIMKSAAKGETVIIRRPDAIRPWQHVLEPLAGYLTIGWKLFAGDTPSAAPWNIGPRSEEHCTVGEVVECVTAKWDKVRFELRPDPAAPHETKLLRLDCSAIGAQFGLTGVWDWREAVEQTVRWYRDFYQQSAISSDSTLDDYIRDAGKLGLVWTQGVG